MDGRGSSRFDDEDGGIRTGRGERALALAMATGGVDEQVSRHCLERELCHPLLVELHT